MNVTQLTPLQRAFMALEEARAKLARLEGARREPIAIVGVGCRAPGGGDNPEALWRVFRQGIDGIVKVPSDRWNADSFYDSDPEVPGKCVTEFGGFVRQIDRFDAALFGISPREAQHMDPQQRLFLEVGWEALELAGIAPDSLQTTKTGVYLGICTNDFCQMQLQSQDLTLIGPHFVSGIAHSIASGRLSYLLGLQGPSISIDTACSSGLVAVHLACQSLRAGECRMAIAGGVNVMASPDLSVALSQARMLAPDGRCKAFDVAADGYGRGEGCGVVVLKRLSDAISDGDRILALIRATAVNQDGPSSGLTAPNGPAQEAVIHEALALAGLSPHEVGYIEAHGTGTQLGDPLEMRALGNVFGPGRPAGTPLYVGSAKTNFGHLEAAAGIIGLVKVVLSLQHREIAPHLHFNNPSPYIPWAELPVVIPTEPIAWSEINGTRIGGVSSFGVSGTNAHAVLEQAPAPARTRPQVERPHHIVSVSAQSESALKAAAGRLAAALDEYGEADLADLAYTLNTGRALLPVRAVFTASTLFETREKLASIAQQQSAEGVVTASVSPGARPRVAFLFTGQGSQYIGMARILHETSPLFRQVLNDCASELDPLLPAPLLSILYPADNAISLLDQTGFAQPALFAVEYALAMLWRQWGIEPTVVLGHSVGEVVAACVAGVLSLPDALRLIVARGRLMQSLPPGGGMRAVFASPDRVEPWLAGAKGEFEIAAFNGPEHIVLSGRLAALDRLGQALEAAGIKSRALQVSHAFHSELMDPILDPFAQELSTVTFNAPRVRLISNLTGRLADPAHISTVHYWRDHIRNPVRFSEGIVALGELKCDAVIEIGPMATLTALGQECLGSEATTWCTSLRRGRDDWLQLLDSLKALHMLGVRIDWTGFEAGYVRRKLDLPTYAFQRERYWFKAPPRHELVHKEKVDDGRSTTQCLHTRQWEVQPLPVFSGNEEKQSWIVLANRGDTGTALTTALLARGHRCLIHRADDDSVGAGAGSASESSLLDHKKLCRQWREQFGDALGIIDLRWLDTVAWLDPNSKSLEAVLAGPISNSLSLVQAMLAEFVNAQPRLWWVTRGAQPAGGERSPLSPWQSALWGLASSVALEHPEFKPVCIDLDPATNRDEIVALISELSQDGREDQVALRDGRRLVSRLVRWGAKLKGERIDPPGPITRPDGIYLITGGLSGLGLTAAQWLIEEGARHLALIGRRGVTEEAQPVLNSLRSAGVTITTAQLDIADASLTAAFLERLREMGVPLRGILHAAGVTDDGAVLAQDWTRFEHVLRPKVAGVQILDQLTRKDPLDWFVMFSSAASLVGSSGQANYCAANAILDCVAHERRRLGRPAQSINWGPWQQIGLAAGKGLQQRISAHGLTPLSPREGLLALGEIMREGEVQVGAIHADWTQLVARRAIHGVPPYFSRLVDPPADGKAPAKTKAETRVLLQEKLEAAAPGRRRAIVKNFVRECTLQVLAQSDSMVLDDRAPLRELGLDSLLAVELRNTLSRLMGVGLSATLLFDYPTVEAVTDHIMNEVWVATKEESLSLGSDPNNAAGSGSTVLAGIAQLSEDEIDRLLALDR